MSRNETENGNLNNSEEIATNHQRLCHIVKRPDFDGYGFNLHSEKGKPGQFIGKVDENSPAELAGLKQDDRIIEVNGVDIGSETHKQVVQRIKAIACEVRLLVIDPELEKLQKSSSTNSNNVTSQKQQQDKTMSSSTASTITVKSSTVKSAGGTQVDGIAEAEASAVTATANESSSISSDNNRNTPIKTVISTRSSSTTSTSPTPPATPPLATMVNGELFIETNSNGSNNSHRTGSAGQQSPPPLLSPSTIEAIKLNATKVASTKLHLQQQQEQQQQQQHQNGNGTSNLSTLHTATPAVSVAGDTNVSTTDGAKITLNLPMTAAEMRAKLLAKKKYDPKNDSVDLKKKFEIIQKL